MNPGALTPSKMIFLVVLWLGFMIFIGALVWARMVKNSFQKRLQQAVMPTEEEVDDIAREERDEEMSRSFAQRLVAPLLKTMGRKMKSKAGGAAGAQIRDMLEQAGHPLGMYYPEFMGLKTFSLMAGVTLGVISSYFLVPIVMGLLDMKGDSTMNLMGMVIWTLVFAFIGFSGPTFWLRRFVNKRIRQIRKAMADVVDLIVLAIEAGLGFDQAVDQAVQKTNGPLTDELRRVLDEVRVGKPQGEAFRDMAQRVKMPELSLLVAAIDQAMKMGVGLGKALRLQATEIRERRMAFIKEQAGKLPVKMMLPLVLFIFPALFVVILGPALAQVVEMSKSGQL